MYEYILSIDLGRFQDYTSIHLMKVVPKIEEVGQLEYNNEYHVFYQDRTTEKYTQITGKINQIMRQPKIIDRTALIVDATGVGAAVVEMLGHHPIGIVIHGGNTVSIREDPPGYSVPKRDLAAALQVVLQSARLKIKKNLPYNEQLMKEFQYFKMEISSNGNDLYENLKASIHDDMILSLAMGVWYGEKFIRYRINQETVADGYDPMT